MLYTGEGCTKAAGTGFSTGGGVFPRFPQGTSAPPGNIFGVTKMGVDATGI